MKSLEDSLAIVSRCVVQNGDAEAWEAIQRLRDAIPGRQNGPRAFVFAGPDPSGLFAVGEPGAAVFVLPTRHAQPVLTLAVRAVQAPGQRVEASDLYEGTRLSAARARVYERLCNAVGQIERRAPGLYSELLRGLQVVADERDTPYILYLPTPGAVIRT